jgi:hypothetical protein
VVRKVSNRFFGAAVAGARCFFGFRPRLFGMGLHGLIRAPLNLSASCECRPTRPDGGGGVTGGERTGGDLGGPRETDCVPGHIGFELANPPRELSDWICVTTSPQVARAGRRRPFACQLHDAVIVIRNDRDVDGAAALPAHAQLGEHQRLELRPGPRRS